MKNLIFKSRFLVLLVGLLTICVTQVWGADPVATATATTGKSYIVAAYDGSKYYALPLITSATTYSGTEVIVNAVGKVDAKSGLPLWTLTVNPSNASQFYLTYKNGSSTYYLYKNGTSDTNYNIKGDTSNKNYWTFTKSADEKYYNIIAVGRGTSHTYLNYYYSKFQVRGTSASTTSNNNTSIILLEVADASPSVSISGSLNSFAYAVGDGPSTAQSFTVSGSNLTADLVVTAPTGYEVCKTVDGSYASSISYNPSTGSVASTTAYIRLKSGLSQGTYNGNITVSSGATNQTKAVEGSVTAAVVKYTVTWHIGSSTQTTSNVPDQTAFSSLSAPEVADDAAGACANKFMGWATSAISGTTDGDGFETIKVSGSTKVSNTCKDFYAVFATSEGGSSVTDVLTYAKTGVVNTGGSDTYKNFSNGSDLSEAVYAGNINAAKNSGSFDYLQLRTNNSNSGIVSTTSGGNVTSVVIAWNSLTTASRQIDVYGSSTAYSSASDLYNNNTKGTLIGSLYANHAENGTTTTIDNISGEYPYIGIRSNDGALYVSSISITYGGSTYTDD